MKKRLISLFLSLAMLLTLLPTTVFAANQFTYSDVASTAWYYDAVDYVSREGIMSGVGNNTFSPDTTLTRAQLCQILYNIEKTPRTGTGSFSDVSGNAWYSNAVNWAAAQGIVNGTGNGLFSPDNPVSREQMVTILYRYATYKDYNLSALVSLSDYSDINLLSSWAEEAMQWAVSEGVISGTTATTIAPQGTATRAQAATMLMRFCQRMEAKQAFYAKNINDFRGKEIINFDSSSETNFAVLAEDTITAKSSPTTNQLVSADEDAGVYTFSNIDQTISALKPGDMLYLTYGSGTDDYLLLKVGTIEVNGDSATVTEGEAEISDYFQYIDVDMEVDLSAAEEVDAISFYQDVATPANLTAVRAIQPANVLAAVSVPTPAMLADNISVNTSSDLKFGIKGDRVSVTADVKPTFKIKICYDETIFNVTEVSFSVKQETKLEGKLSKNFTGTKDTYKEPMSKPVTIPVAAGLDVKFQAYFVFDVDASVDGTFSGTITTENGTKYSGGESYPINESDADFSFDFTGNFNISTGFGITASAEVLKVFKISLSGEAGVELDGKAEIIHVSTQQEEKHLCMSCTDGTINAYFELDFKVKVGISDDDKFLAKLLAKFDRESSLTLIDYKLAKVKVELRKFYISFAGGALPVEFGWGKCPHKQYLVTVVAMDQFGNRLTGVLVNVHNNDTDITPVPDKTTEEQGIYRVYCGNGNYTITGYGLDGYQDASETVDVSGGAKTVMIQMDKDTVTSGIMICDVYGEGEVIGIATMNILSDKEAVFSMKFTADNYGYTGYDGNYDWIDSAFDYYNTYSIGFGGNWDGNWENYEAPLFDTGYSTFHPWGDDSPDEYTRNGIRYLPNNYGYGSSRNYYTEPFLCSDLKEDLVNQEASWRITVSDTVDFSFYDLEGETMSAEAIFTFI